MNKQKILILGAGFGGVRAALDLAHFGGSGALVTLVDRHPYHIYTPDLYEVASAYIKEGRDFSRAEFYRLASTAAVPLSQIFHKYKNVHLVQGEITAIDLAGRAVATLDGKKINYDRLIFALGSEPAYYDIPHIKEYAVGFKTLNDALNVRDAVDEALSRLPKNKPVRVAVAGGGFAGVELAAELVDFLRSELKMHARPRDGFSVTVIEAGAELFGGVLGRAGRLAAERLKKLGVRIATNAKIADVKKEAVILDSGEEIVYDVLVSTAGVCASGIASKLGVPTAAKGCLVIDDHLRMVADVSKKCKSKT
ncbi:MAG: FAD-dependent oxidoreductase [Candidatus Niyogibacteria bacterium]|nr:FAD-dependent oxidoreductase [Candidatus Niyogibacteria bacterium]